MNESVNDQVWNREGEALNRWRESYKEGWIPISICMSHLSLVDLSDE